MVKTRKLSVEKCTKEQCMQCDMGYILRHFYKPIMQCLTMDIPNYYMRLLTTKCLNNAVSISYLLLGPRGIKVADSCDSHDVQRRHKEGNESNAPLLKALRRNILNKKAKYRQLYYILMTDAEFPHDDGTPRHFPGHVFVLEKIPDETEPYFYFHQAYINQYDYDGHIRRNNNSLARSWDDIKRMMEQIHYVLMNPTWDENSVKYWKEISFVNTKNLLGAKSGGRMFLCWRKSRVTDCIDRLESYSRKKLKQISKMKIAELDKIYGDPSAYDSNQKPLTVRQMKHSLEKLTEEISKSKMQ